MSFKANEKFTNNQGASENQKKLASSDLLQASQEDKKEEPRYIDKNKRIESKLHTRSLPTIKEEE